ncbi:haloacid dehalogenase, type II [Fonsecaea monophora]|uniref:Haloacid dehalogenase, type II n=1 Tax=Fonsecaea monophora TaxID=254056 RepID=A0A177FCM8_9EURO|nr:haloacid dehalogenase, type II [Fonsecaea monophora]KAH0837130.1 haloalkanoic acid dehalogenase [Fonsecaea pedrosoi]OAG41212.1 haloacid dehalogenase, type II [Fonsecaea monophora]
MAKLTDFRLLCFDVYGTLIDWETGIVEGLKPLSEPHKLTRDQTLALYHELEKEQQLKTPEMPYAQLVAAVYPQFAARVSSGEDTAATAPSAQECEAFGQSVGAWPAFPDTVDALRRLSRHYKLVVLSNVDRASFAATNAGPLGGVRFDKIITAQDVGSYKPDLRNFEYMLEAVKAEFGVEKHQVLQTAQSQFHDHHPAREVGIKSVWIERRGTMGNRDREVYDWKFVTLGDMADAVEREVELASKS